MAWGIDRAPLGRHIAPWHQKRFVNNLRQRYQLTTPMAKPDKDHICMRCGRNDMTYPSPDAVICPTCTKRLNHRAVQRVLDDLYMPGKGPPCFFCGVKGDRMYKVSGRMCQACTGHVARNIRELIQHKRRNFKFE
jgi:hypothetical protein